MTKNAKIENNKIEKLKAKNLKTDKLTLKETVAPKHSIKLDRIKEFTCVSCPMGCTLQATPLESGEFKISGNQCKRGLVYGLQEMKAPTRNISSTVCVIGAEINSLPVKTAEPIPKGKIFEIMKEINKITVKAPVQVGDVIIENILGTGVDIVASRSL